MATDNKFVVERTNVLAADAAVLATYGAVDADNFGFYGKAGETYTFEAKVVYSASAAGEGAAFSVTAPATPTAIHFVSEYNTDATTVVRTACVAIDTPDHGTASVSGLNLAHVYGTITPSTSGFVAISGIAENAGAIVAKGTLSSLVWRRLYVADNA